MSTHTQIYVVSPRSLPALPPDGMRSGQAVDGRNGGTEPDWGAERWRGAGGAGCHHG